MTHHSRFRASFVSAVGVVLLLAAAAPSWAEPEVVPAAAESTGPRIVGGVEVDPPGKYPFIVAVLYSSEPDTYLGQFCGGSLVASQWVLTAGHCVSFAEADEAWEIDVLVGRHDLRNGTDGERIGVAEIYRHPGYDDETLADDLALLLLERPTTLGAPIALATPADGALFAAGEIATVIGWGSTLGEPPGTAEYPDALREVQVPMVSDQVCSAAYGADFILPGMICAGDFAQGGVDSCYGDSGGPLFVATAAGYRHVGIVSTGNECALPGWPGIYTRTAVYETWIAATLATPLPQCQGRPATILGTVGDDVLYGTSGDDVIVARDGDDTIYGRDGNDLICAGAGVDTIYGGAGDDVILGQPGGDYAEGNRGADLLIGGLGPDTLLGGEDGDTIYGNAGNDTLGGLDGSDSVYGGAGADSLSGGAGDDRLAGGPGADLLLGGEGADALFGGLGGDEAYGGAGPDTIYGGGGNDVLYGDGGCDLIRGGIGVDTCYTGEDVDCEAGAVSSDPR